MEQSGRRKNLIARRLVDFSDSLVDCPGPVAVGVFPGGSVYVAAGKTAEPLTVESGIGVFPKSRLAKGTSYVVLHWKGEEQRRMVVDGEDIVVSFVQPTPDGVLLAGARCHWRPEGAEENGVEYGWDGRELRRLSFGDGIQDLRTTPNGSIWTSYFDEGVIGNYGWNHPGPECIGASGCVRFDTEGNVIFQFSPDTAGTDAIIDAYAMNVIDDDDVWIYFYNQFPIVHISNGNYCVWEWGIRGAHGLAVGGIAGTSVRSLQTAQPHSNYSP